MLDYILYIAAFIMILSYIPQIIKIIKTKSSGDLSFITWIIWIVVMSIMFIHAYTLNDIPFMISQGGQVIMLLFVLCLMLKYHWKKKIIERKKQ